VALGTLAAFLAILAFLAFQVRAGHDPALSRSGQVAAVQQAAAPRRVIVRKVEDDYVITKVIPAPQQAGTSVQPALTAGSSGGGSSVQSSPSVVSSSPAPVPAPAAPAPVTRTS
jgi:hypothetical protein